MSNRTTQIDIASPSKRYNSNSPTNRASNLTVALQQAGADANASQTSQPVAAPVRPPAAMDVKQPAPRSDSLSIPQGGASYTASRPMPVGQRRESVVMGGGSYMGGMSWSGMSMGSFLQDDIMMGGMSPGLNSPSLHSSSYLPRIEANFWNNLKCCDTIFGNLHELVAHFEEVHKQAPSNFPYAMSGPGSDRLPRRKSSVTNPGDWRNGMQQTANPVRGFPPNGRQYSQENMRKQSTINMQDMDTIGEMEMDDDDLTGQTPDFFPGQDLDYSGQSTPQLDHAVPNSQNGFQSSNSSTPPGDAQAQQAHFNSSLYPTMNQTAFGAQNTQDAQRQQQFQQGFGGSADPFGTNGFDSQYTSNTVAFDTSVLAELNNNFRGINFGSGNDLGIDLCINEPAKNLYSADGGFNSQQFPHFNFTSKVDSMSNGDENAKKLQAQRLAAGVGKQPTEEERPFKCPVIGCEKAYKNANGLRYHEKHGHQTQKLKENGDGTFSIVDPLTSIPYPGTVGMEKEKPYRCEVCGKRYKNLNGLKYHRNHSPPCNPEFSQGQMPSLHADMGLDGEAVY